MVPSGFGLESYAELASKMLRQLDAKLGLENFPTYRQDGAGKPDIPFLPLSLLFTLSVYMLETYLDHRQHRLLKEKSPPSTLLRALKTVDSENEGLNSVSKVRCQVLFPS